VVVMIVVVVVVRAALARKRPAEREQRAEYRAN
jgi:hypothetical protein